LRRRKNENSPKNFKKLDKIENELKNLNQGMLSLEERVSFLEKSYNQLRQDLDYRISSLEKSMMILNTNLILIMGL